MSKAPEIETSFAVANFFAQLDHDQKEFTCAERLHGLVVLSHGLHLALTGEPLINEGLTRVPSGSLMLSTLATHYYRAEQARGGPIDVFSLPFGNAPLQHPCEDFLIFARTCFTGKLFAPETLTVIVKKRLAIPGLFTRRWEALFGGPCAPAPFPQRQFHINSFHYFRKLKMSVVRPRYLLPFWQ